MKCRISLFFILLCCSLLSGCWDYRGLNDIDIVTGVAVDKDEDTGLYQLTFEIVNTHAVGNEGEAEAFYVESQGKTTFDAIRNSKKRLINKLYGGNMQTLVISHQIAKTEGVSVILEELLRDGEPRETMSVVISQEETAKEILLTEGLDSKIISYEINEMIEEDNRVTAAIMNVPLYNAYNAIKGTGNVLVLPAIRCVQNGEKTVAEGNGIAVFQGDVLTEFLTVEQTKNYLFAVDKINGGALSFSVDNPEKSISIEIKSSNTQADVSYRDGQISISLSIKVKLNVMEMPSQLSLTQAQHRKKLEQLAADYLEESILTFLKDVQLKQKRDIFGFGRLIYQKYPDLWRLMEENQIDFFPDALINVTVEAIILSSGVLKDY